MDVRCDRCGDVSNSAPNLPCGRIDDDLDGNVADPVPCPGTYREISELSEPATTVADAAAKAFRLPLSGGTTRFLQGVNAAVRVAEAHADTDFPDHDTRVRAFWFFVGALATGEYGCESETDFVHFISGAAPHAPKRPDHDDDQEDTES